MLAAAARARALPTRIPQTARCRVLSSSGAATAQRCSSAAATSAATTEALDFLAARGRALGMPLSLSERQLIASEASVDGDGKMSAADWERVVSRRLRLDQERLTIAEYLTKSHDLHLGQHLLKWTARLGVSFLAVTGANAAGEAGMHVVGACVVGCISGLGGGTLNNLMVGVTPVGWMRDVSFLALALAASLAGFYLFPLVGLLAEEEEQMPESRGARAAGGDSLTAVSMDGPTVVAVTPSLLRYGIESIALGALCVIGAQQGIVRGLPPLASATLGVTVAFGGMVRDLLCKREVALGKGCQSYAAASFAGASVYVALRQLHVLNCAGSTAKLVHGGIPIGARILLGAGTAIGIRVYAWQQKPGDIFSSMGDCAAANHEWVRRLAGRS